MLRVFSTHDTIYILSLIPKDFHILFFGKFKDMKYLLEDVKICLLLHKTYMVHFQIIHIINQNGFCQRSVHMFIDNLNSYLQIKHLIINDKNNKILQFGVKISAQNYNKKSTTCGCKQFVCICI